MEGVCEVIKGQFTKLPVLAVSVFRGKKETAGLEKKNKKQNHSALKWVIGETQSETLLIVLKWSSCLLSPMCLLPGCTSTCWMAHCWLWCSLWSTLGWWVTSSSLISKALYPSGTVFHFLWPISSGGDVILHFWMCTASCVFAVVSVVSFSRVPWHVPWRATDRELNYQKKKSSNSAWKFVKFRELNGC